MVDALLAALVILSVALALWQRERLKVHSQAHLTERLRAIARETPDDPASLLQERHFSTIPRLNEVLARLRLTVDFERLVRHAGLRIRVGEALLWMGLAGMLIASAAFALKGSLVLAGASFWAGPGLGIAWLRRRRRQRRQAITGQLPDALDMIRSSLQAGHSFNHALELVGEEAPEPLAAEARQVLDELRLGHPIKEALEGIYHRTGIEDLRFFTIAVLLNREIGGNLSDIIDVVTATMRERFKLKGQIRSLTAQGRMSALVLTLLTPTLVLVLTILNSEYLEPLYFTKIGRFMLGYCVLSIAFGYHLMRRIVDIKIIRTD